MLLDKNHKDIVVGDMHLEIANYTCENLLTYAKAPSRVLSGDLVLKYVDKYFIPQVEVRVKKLTAEQYSNLMAMLRRNETINIEYLDYELNKVVSRKMVVAAVTKGEFVFVNDNSVSAAKESKLVMLNATIKFESQESYNYNAVFGV